MKLQQPLNCLTLVLAGALALGACSKQAPPPAAAPPPPPPPAAAPAPAPAPVPAAPAPVTTLTSVTLGNALGADGKIAAAATSFAPKDTIYAAVETNTVGELNSKIAATWTYQGGIAVSSNEQDISAHGAATTTFNISKPSGFPAGQYTLQVSVDGKVVNTTTFDVK